MGNQSCCIMSFVCDVGIRDVPLDVLQCANAMEGISIEKCMTAPNKIIERNYVSELKCAICKKAYKRKVEDDILVSVEVKKQIDNAGTGKSDYYPDIVFHESHEKKDAGKQHMIGEVKTTKSLYLKNFKHDFLKLNLYLDKLNFEKAVYFLIYTSKEKVEKLLEEYMTQDDVYLSPKSENIFFLIQGELHEKVKIYRFNKTKETL